MPHKILYVDDDADMIDLVKNRLEDQHYIVISTNDGHDGIEMAKEEKPDLIIIDIMMPRMMGGEVVKSLQKDEATRDIPIMFLTSLTSDIPREKKNGKINVDGQFFTAISKPFEPDQLLSTIRDLIGGG